MTERITDERLAELDLYHVEPEAWGALIAERKHTRKLEAQVAAREREVDVMQSQRNLAQAEVAALKAECANAGNYGLALEKAEATIAEMLSTLEEEQP